MFSPWYQFRWTLCKYVAAIFFAAISFSAFTQPAFACGGNAEVKAAKTDITKINDLDATVFFNSDGACGDGAVRIDLQYVQGNATTLVSVNCPKENSGDGVYCVIPSSGVYQLHYACGSEGFCPVLPSGKISLVGQVYFNDTLVVKTGALDINIASSAPPDASSQPTIIQDTSKAPPPVDVVLQVKIGDLAKTSNIALYLATLFNYGLGIVGTIAITFVIWGGVKYLTAGGDSGKTTKAKETITNAVTGLILAFATYLILSTVNPALVNFQALTIKSVQRALLTQDSWCEDILQHANLYSVDPPKGSCGDQGTIKAKDSNTKTLTDKCTFKKCNNFDEVCSKTGTGNTYGCKPCQYWTDDALTASGAGTAMSFNNSTCLARGQYQMSKEKGTIIACVYSNDPVYHTPGCATLSVSCDNIKTCQDYGTQPTLSVGGPSGWKVSFERHCLLGLSGGTKKTGAAGAVAGAYAGKILGPWGAAFGAVAGFGAAYFSCAGPEPAGHVALLCTNDPCHVGGSSGCQPFTNKEGLSKLTKYTGVSVSLGDAALEYCCPKGSDCGPPS